MEREQFTFYRSFWEALKALPKKDQLPFISAIGYYVFEEECKPLTGAAAASFLLVKPILDKASKKAASGKLGGSKPKANSKQTANYIEEEREEEKEKDIYPPTPLRDAGDKKRDIPALTDVQEAAKAMGCPELAQPFFDYYAAGNWRDSDGKPVTSWRQKLTAWKTRADDKLRKQAPTERKTPQADPNDWEGYGV